MKFMYPSNNILVLCFSLLIILGCEDKEEPPIGDESEPCSPYCEDSSEMICKQGQCLCDEEMFFTSWRYSGDLCNDLTDSFYVRVAHDGNIDYFEAMDILRMPASKPLKQNSSISISEDYPKQFIVEFFSSRSDTIDYKKYHPAYFALVFDNAVPGNDAFPIVGNSNLSPSDYRPIHYRRGTDEGYYYGVNFIWKVEYSIDSATLHIDVYTSGDGSIYLDDEITMYFERYRE